MDFHRTVLEAHTVEQDTEAYAENARQRRLLQKAAL